MQSSDHQPQGRLSAKKSIYEAWTEGQAFGSEVSPMAESQVGALLVGSVIASYDMRVQRCIVGGC